VFLSFSNVLLGLFLGLVEAQGGGCLGTRLSFHQSIGDCGWRGGMGWGGLGLQRTGAKVDLVLS
jgi:hypothetical protein